MNDILYSGIVIAAAFVAGAAVNLAIALILNRLDSIVKLRGLRNIFYLLKPPLRLTIPMLFFTSVTPLLKLPGEIQVIFEYVVDVLLIAGIGWLAARLIAAAREIILSRYDIQAKDNLQARRVYTQIRVIQHVLTTIVAILTLSFILMTFPKVRQIGVSILASAGIAGVVIGFAAQKILGNFIAGIQIAFTQPIRIDDSVVVEGEWGRIEEISLTYVVIKIWDMRRLIVPISYFVENTFQNWTRVSADLMGTVLIYTDYKVPVERLRQALTAILAATPLWDKKVNVLQVTDLKERTIELRALVSSIDAGTLWDLRCLVREKFLELLQKEFPESLPRTRLIVENVK